MSFGKAYSRVYTSGRRCFKGDIVEFNKVLYVVVSSHALRAIGLWKIKDPGSKSPTTTLVTNIENVELLESFERHSLCSWDEYLDTMRNYIIGDNVDD